MRTFAFAKRNIKELIRDPLSVVFIIVLPIFLLIIFQQFNIPNDAYKIENFTPSIAVFGLSFITLFIGQLIAKDRSTSLLTRLYTSPMTSIEYILGYTLSLIPIIIIQNILFFIVAIILGLQISINIILTILVLILLSLLFIGLGLIIGLSVSDKAAAGCGSVVVQIVCFTSGMYFSFDMLGTIFKKICEFLPFSHILNIAKGILNNTPIYFNDILISMIYIIIVYIIAVYIFKKRMINK